MNYNCFSNVEEISHSIKGFEMTRIYMKLKKEEIDHVATLARLDLTDQEKEMYQNQLSDIFGYIDQLSEVNVEGVEPTAQVTGLENVYREDKIKVWDNDERITALEQAPELEDGQVKVKRVL